MFKMKKGLIIGILVVAVLAVGFTAGYLVKNQDSAAESDKGTTASTEASTKESANGVDIEKVYNDFLASSEAEKYYHLLEEDEGEEYIYSGEKEVKFFDIDGDGVAECFLRVGYYVDEVSPDSRKDEQICLFDADGENVRFVMSTGACAPFRAYEKFRLVKTEDGTYEIFRYIRDANKILEGTVYSYDGKEIKFEKSFFADIYPVEFEEKSFFVSTTKDMFDTSAANYSDYKAAEKVTEEAFFEQWNYYESEAECVHQVPEKPEAN